MGYLDIRRWGGWIAVATALALGGCDTPRSDPELSAQALVGGTLIDGTGAAPVSDAVVVVRDGRIDCAGSRSDCAVPRGARTIDVSGKWITPGIIDSHVHFSQTAFADGRPDFLDLRELYPYEQVESRLRNHPETQFRSYLCSGVTAVFDVGGYPWTWGLPELAENDTSAPHVASAGPLLSTLDHWLNLPAERQFMYFESEEKSVEFVRYIHAHGAAAVKIWFIAVSDEEFEDKGAAVLAAGAEAKRLGIPLIVHATDLREAKVAVQAGAHLLVHSVWDQPVDEEFIEMVRDTGTIYNPTLIVGGGYLAAAEAIAAGEVPAMDDPNGCIDPWTRDKIEAIPELSADLISEETLRRRRERVAKRNGIGDANLMTLLDAGIPIAMGTDAGNVLTFHGPSVYAETEAMQAAGMTPEEVLVSATSTAARAMLRSDIGTLAAGQIADLLVLGSDPLEDITNIRSLEMVMRGGSMRSVQELAAVASAPGDID